MNLTITPRFTNNQNRGQSVGFGSSAKTAQDASAQAKNFVNHLLASTPTGSDNALDLWDLLLKKLNSKNARVKAISEEISRRIEDAELQDL